MAELSHLQVEDLLYSTLEARSNGNHNPQGERAGTELKLGRTVQKMDGAAGRYGLVVSVASDDERSRNAPYHFVVEAYAFVTIVGAPVAEADIEQFISQNGLPYVMGAIRERLAELTARMPWGRFLINALPLPEAQTITSV